MTLVQAVYGTVSLRLATVTSGAMATSKDAAKAPKPALSSKLMGLKFMQRAAHKEAAQSAATESSQPSEDVSLLGGVFDMFFKTNCSRAAPQVGPT